MEAVVEQITSFRGRWKVLSNFAMTPFKTEWYGHDRVFHFKSVEHYFQAAKCHNFDDAKMIVNSSSPRTAKHLGHKVELRDSWDEVKLDVMLTGLRCKFSNPLWSNILLSTRSAFLIEGNTWDDRYWGMVQLNGANGPVWVGENHLGILLMQVRKELQEKSQ